MKEKCETLGAVLLVFGIIGSIILAYNCGFVVDTDYSYLITEKEMNFLL